MMAAKFCFEVIDIDRWAWNRSGSWQLEISGGGVQVMVRWNEIKGDFGDEFF